MLAKLYTGKCWISKLVLYEGKSKKDAKLNASKALLVQIHQVSINSFKSGARISNGDEREHKDSSTFLRWIQAFFALNIG